VRKSRNSGDSANVLINKNPVRALQIFSWYQNRAQCKIMGVLLEEALESRLYKSLFCTSHTCENVYCTLFYRFYRILSQMSIRTEWKVGEIRFTKQLCVKDMTYKLMKCIYFESSLSLSLSLSLSFVIIFHVGAHGGIISFYMMRGETTPTFSWHTGGKSYFPTQYILTIHFSFNRRT